MLEITLDAINDLKGTITLEQFRDKTLSIIEMQYGRCSYEYFSFVRAWNRVCVPSGMPSCGFYLRGQNRVCEGNSGFQLCLNHWNGGVIGGSTNDHRWTIIGPNSTQFQSALGMSGNTQFGGTCLNISSIPEYPY
jgi:hypothetical protein